MKLELIIHNFSIVFRNLRFSTIGGVVSKLVTLLMYIILSRILKPEMFGTMSVVISPVLFVGAVASIGLPVAFSKLIPEYRLLDNINLNRILSGFIWIGVVSAFVFSIFFYILSDWLAEIIYSDSSLGNYFKIMSIYLFSISINSIQIGLLSGFEDFKNVARLNIINSLVSSFFVLTFAYFFLVNGAFIGFCISGILAILINNLFLKKSLLSNGIKLISTNFFVDRSIICKFLVPMFISTLIVAPLNSIANYFLLKGQNTYTDVAAFNLAFQWYNAVLFLPSLFATVILPILTRSFYSSDVERRRKILYNLLLNGLIALCLSLLVYLSSDFLVEIYGKEFTMFSSILSILLVNAVIVSCVAALGQVLISTGRVWISLGLNLVWIGLFIHFCYLLATRGFGSMGVAYSFLFSYISLGVLTLIFTWSDIFNSGRKSIEKV